MQKIYKNHRIVNKKKIKNLNKITTNNVTINYFHQHIQSIDRTNEIERKRKKK